MRHKEILLQDENFDLGLQLPRLCTDTIGMNPGGFVRSISRVYILVCAFICLMTLNASAQSYVPGEVIVRFKGKSSSTAVNQLVGKMQGKISLKSSQEGLNIHRFTMKAGEDVMMTVNELQQDSSVQYAEPNYILTKFETPGPTSQEYTSSEVHSMFQAGDSYQQSYAAVNVDGAWPQMSTLAQVSSKTIVAIIDTGVDYNHEVFHDSGAMWINPNEIAGNGVDDDGNGYVDDIYGWNFHDSSANPMDNDSHGHGTHVAGVVLGVGQDIMAATLESARIQIMALKFLGADGSGSTSDAVAAIYYAVRNGAKVINNSWGGSSYSQSLHDAITYAYNQHVLVVSAAGNYGKNNDSNDMYPANYPVPGQIVVAATNDSDALASFSNYGASSVHIAAPGVSILSSTPNNSYRYMSGTSMATPFISGLAAMMFREATSLTGYQIKNLLTTYGDSVAALNTKTTSHKRTNAYSAIVAAKGQSSTAAFQPNYVQDNSRAPAAVSTESTTTESAPKGCGLVSTVIGGGSGGSQSMGFHDALVFLSLLALPVVVWQLVRRKALSAIESRRRFDRFVMDSEIKVLSGGKMLVAQMKTISQGGLSFNAQSLLDKGGILTMQIQSPDGREVIQVQGHVVWSEKNESYGVQFDSVQEAVSSSIQRWSSMLLKA